MKKTTSMKSKPTFAKKKANAKNPLKASDRDTKNPTPEPDPQPQPPSDAVSTQVDSPTPEVRPCSPAETQKGHHEVVQS